MTGNADFTPAGYGVLLDSLLARGYVARDFATADPAGRDLILRHDLDMSLEAALPIAEIEKGRGVSATYFVLVRTEMYNPFSPAAERALGRIITLGHRIGLHLDASLYADSDSLARGAAAEAETLERIVGREVRTVSFHRPAPELLGDPRPIAGRLHAYQPRFFSEMGYCSDSRGEWSAGHPLEHASIAKGQAMQLLTHPIWWVAARGETPRSKLDRFALRRFDRLRAELARNCLAYPQSYRALDPDEDSA